MMIKRKWCERGYSSGSHNSRYVVDHGSIKMYHYLKQLYWWKHIKKGVANFVYNWLTCEHINDKNKLPIGLLR